MSTNVADPEARTFRGRTLEALLPQIREALGADAVVVRQRDGLMGGIGGFFQQRFVEVDARAGHARVDVYDEPPVPAADVARQLADAEQEAEPVVTAAASFGAALPRTGEQLAPPAPAPVAAPTPAEPVAPASDPAPAIPDFATFLAAATPAEPGPAAPKRAPRRRSPAPKRAPARARKAPARPASAPAPRATPAAPSTRAARALTTALTARGLSDDFAAALVADALAHELPFAPGGDPRAATRAALARRIPALAPPRADGRTVAFAGPPGAGKTHCAAALAAAYARAGAAPVLALALAPDDDGAELRRLLEPHDVAVHAVATPGAARTRIRRAPKGAVVVLDTPPVAPADAKALAALATRLAALAPGELHLTLPATLGPGPAAELHERLAPLRPHGIALTHADATDHLGAVVELACTTALPLAFVATAGEDLATALRPADPCELAERLLA
jgi:flagellar biosynthesis GTPase FlhF